MPKFKKGHNFGFKAGNVPHNKGTNGEMEKKNLYLLPTADFLTKCLIWFRINSVHSRKGENCPAARVLSPPSTEEANWKKSFQKA